LGLSCRSAAIQFGVLLLIASNYFAADDGAEQLWRMRCAAFASKMIPLTFGTSPARRWQSGSSHMIAYLVRVEAR
jgi:hypothetical protein